MLSDVNHLPCRGYRENRKWLICGKVSISNVLLRDSRTSGEELIVLICLLTDCALHKNSDESIASLYPAILIPYSDSNDC